MIELKTQCQKEKILVTSIFSFHTVLSEAFSFLVVNCVVEMKKFLVLFSRILYISLSQSKVTLLVRGRQRLECSDMENMDTESLLAQKDDLENVLKNNY